MLAFILPCTSTRFLNNIPKTNDAQRDKQATKMSTVAAIDTIVRIVCKRFHGFSNPALACAISLPEAVVTSNFASF
jgi:hypothetical protein